jgi:hypothetical protein
MQINLDKADLCYFVAKLARAKLRYGTKESEIGPDGQGIYLVDLVVFGEDMEIITVRIVGEPKGLTKKEEVRVSGPSRVLGRTVTALPEFRTGPKASLLYLPNLRPPPCPSH